MQNYYTAGLEEVIALCEGQNEPIAKLSKDIKANDIIIKKMAWGGPRGGDDGLSGWDDVFKKKEEDKKNYCSSSSWGGSEDSYKVSYKDLPPRREQPMSSAEVFGRPSVVTGSNLHSSSGRMCIFDQPTAHSGPDRVYQRDPYYRNDKGPCCDQVLEGATTGYVYGKAEEAKEATKHWNGCSYTD